MVLPIPAASDDAGDTEAIDPAPADVSDRQGSPLRLAAARFRRDRLGMTCLCVVVFFVLVGALAPVIGLLYGKNPSDQYGQERPGLLGESGEPLAPNGGMSGQSWFGLEPGLGRDVFMQLVYGIRTSLIIAFASVLLTTVVGIAVGVTVGYLGGLVDRVFTFVGNVLLAFPTLLLLLAVTPVVNSRLVGPRENVPVWMQFAVVITVFALFGWVGHALVLRSLVRSLREREFVQAAQAVGTSRRRVVFTELLPNLVGPVIVHVTLAVPAYVTVEAALSFLGVGISEPTPDWGRMIARGAEVFFFDPTYMFFPGLSLLVFVLAFNLLGDAVRDALDPKMHRA